MNIDFKLGDNTEEENCVLDDLYPSVKDAITKIAVKEGYIRPIIHRKIFSADGGNCFGVLYKINIKGETIEGKLKETNLFAKHVTPSCDNITQFSVCEIYNTEIFVYTELAQIFLKLQNRANIPLEKRFKLVKIYDESNTDAIILEDMTKQGFKTYGRVEIMKLSYAELCVEQLAKFHSLAFIIEREMPEYFENKIKTLKQSLNTDDNYKAFANKMYQLATRMFPSDLKSKTDKWWEKALEDYFEYLQGTMTTVKCLCHGDFKANNVMYKEMDGNITEVIAVDYQFTYYGSPVLDLILFISMGTDKNFRKKHLSQLKDHYYVSLKEHLEFFGVPVDHVYPKKLFQKDFDNCLDYALVSSICVLPFSLYAEEGMLELVDKDIMHLGVKFDNTYYDRLQGVFDDFF